ncbi:hypothetical protein AOLI_G00061780 [Acnodon oligacanthus]
MGLLGGRLQQSRCVSIARCVCVRQLQSFIKPISRRGELREEAPSLGSHNNGALKGRGESKLEHEKETIRRMSWKKFNSCKKRPISVLQRSGQ